MQMATPISPLWGVGEAHLAVQEVSRNTRPTSFHCCIAPKTLLGLRYVRSNSFTFRGANPKLMFYLMPPSKGEQKHHTSTCHRSVWALNPDPTPCRPFLSRDCRCEFMLSFMIFFFSFCLFLKFFFLQPDVTLKLHRVVAFWRSWYLKPNCVTEASPVSFPLSDTATARARCYIYMPTCDKQMALTAVRLCVVKPLAWLHQTVNEYCII